MPFGGPPRPLLPLGLWSLQPTSGLLELISCRKMSLSMSSSLSSVQRLPSSTGWNPIWEPDLRKILVPRLLPFGTGALFARLTRIHTFLGCAANSGSTIRTQDKTRQEELEALVLTFRTRIDRLFLLDIPKLNSPGREQWDLIFFWRLGRGTRHCQYKLDFLIQHM